MQRGGRSGRGGRGGSRGNSQGGHDANSGVSGNTDTGLFTAGGRDRIGGGGGGGPVRDSGRSGRSSRRGGILRGYASLPSRPGREDQDGDAMMGGDKPKTFNPYQRPGRSTRSETSKADTGITMHVSGSPRPAEIAADTGIYDFICRKSLPTKVNISNKRVSGGNSGVSFNVENITQAQVVRKLSGIRYKGQKLVIRSNVDDQLQHGRPSSTSTSAPSGSTIEAIRNFIRSRYSNGVLMLSNMPEDPILKAAKITPPGSASRSEVGAVMMKVASELFGNEIESISFDSNGLRSFQSVSTLAQFLPKVKNLSFADNNIRHYKDLVYLANKKLPNLRELILLGNPVRDNDVSKNGDDMSYRSEITKLFPSVELLDRVPVAPKISFGLGDLTQVASTSGPPPLPAPIRANFYDNPQTEATVGNFLTMFFQLYDSSRAELMDLYGPSSTFSYCIQTSISPLQKSQGKGGDQWSDYQKYTRNLLRVNDLGEKTNRLFVGNVAIVQQCLMTLPATRHDLSDPAKFCVDAFQTPGLLSDVCIFANVHGEFEHVQTQNGKNVRKSFDRAFVIGPAPAGSNAANKGWPCVIISDQLTIRHYNGSAAWTPEREPASTSQTSAFASGGMSQNTPSSIPAPLAVAVAPGVQTGGFQLDPNQAPMPGMTLDQHNMTLELQRRTGLNYAYAAECLTAVKWNLVDGVALVEQERPRIPANAWLPGAQA